MTFGAAPGPSYACVFPWGGCPWAKGELAHGVYSILVIEMHSRSMGELSAPLSAFFCLVQASLEALHSSQVTDFPGEIHI